LKHEFFFGTQNVIWLHGREKCIHQLGRRTRERKERCVMIFARVVQKRERKLISSLLSALLYYAREEERIFSFEELAEAGATWEFMRVPRTLSRNNNNMWRRQRAQKQRLSESE
jgi:hypothetical protein